VGFDRPQMLLFLLAVPALVGFLRVKDGHVLTALRGLIVSLVIVCLAGPHVDLTEPGVDVIALLDRSYSIGEDGRRTEAEIVSLLGRARSKHDRIGVVGFGAAPVIETPPAEGSAPAFTERQVDPNGSNMAAALQAAAQMISPRRKTRVVIFSDGVYTGRDPTSPRVIAQLSGVPVWYRYVGKAHAGDVAAASVFLPPEVTAGTAYVVRFSITAETDALVKYSLSRGGSILAEGEAAVPKGETTMFARDIAEGEGILEYRLKVSTENDPIPENNNSTALMRVVGAPRVLVASGIQQEGLLISSLKAAAIPVDSVDVAGFDWNPVLLSQYRVIILENLPLDKIGVDGVKSIASCVKTGVSALLITGGEGSFGQGGYFKSSVDPLLPVSMELRQEQRRGLMALVTILDRSGSMAIPVAGNIPKIKIADAAAVEAMRLLSSMDQVGVVAVDSAPVVIVPLTRADNVGELSRVVMRLDAEGGGIFVHAGLQAGAKEVRKSKLPTRHMILFADSADSEDQDGCVDLAAKLASEGIGLSIVGLGTPQDVDADFLRAVALAGRGEAYFTADPEQLPRIFSQEVIRVSQRGFVREATATSALPDILRVGLPSGIPTPRLGGYNLCSLRDGASCAVVTQDDYKAPAVAFWQKGRASVAAITAEIDGPCSGDFATWQKAPELIVGTVRLIASGITTSSAKAYSSFRSGHARVTVELDEQTSAKLRSQPVELMMLPPSGGEPSKIPLRWERPDTLCADMDLSQPGHYLPIVDLGEGGVVKAPPVTLSYSPEFLPSVGLDGENILADVAAATGGKQLGRVDEAFSGEGTTALRSQRDLRPWLALALLVLVLLEVAERRLAFSQVLMDVLARRRRGIDAEG